MKNVKSIKKNIRGIYKDLLPGEGRILVMDDEMYIRRSVKMFLQRLGYEVEVAEDGYQAIQLYKQTKVSGRPFDAVILDLTVPGSMGGKGAIKELLEIDPEVKAIVSSGYSDDPLIAEYKNYGFKAVLSKPFSLEELGKVLRILIRGSYK